MSLTQRIKQGYLRLPGAEKAIFIGSGLIMLSPLLPWYDSMKGYVIETIMGVSGPLFLLGILTMAFGGLTFFHMFMPFLGSSFFKNSELSKLANFCGFEALLMLVISNSIFFSTDFGGAVTHKGTRFGMMIAFAGIALTIGGAYFAKGKSRNVVEVKENFYSTPVQMPVEPVANPLRTSSEEMDARDKYRAMSSQARQNLWQRRADSPFSKLDAIEKNVTDNMKIRTDL